MLLLILDDLRKDGDAGFVTKLTKLRSIFGNVAAFINFKAAQGEVRASHFEVELFRLAALAAGVSREFAAESRDASRPNSAWRASASARCWRIRWRSGSDSWRASAP